MKSPTLIRNIGIGILVIVVIAGAYVFLVRGNTGSELLLTATSGPSPVAPGGSLPTGVAGIGSQDLREITTILNELKSISIDGALFENPAFRSLTDFHLEIAPQPQGRANPFLPGEGVKSAQPGR